MIELTEEQTTALEALLSSEEQSTSLGGLAGTGKTTLVKELRRRIEDQVGQRPKVVTLTGKAAEVLRRKGVRDASTIHSNFYFPVETGDPDNPLEFEFRGDEARTGYLIIDEASMVPEEVYFDLVNLGTKLFLVGDHGQLSPVSNEKNNFNLMSDPDVKLETIHRYAGELEHFAHWLREGGSAMGFGTRKQVEIVKPGHQSGADQIIVATNQDRVKINRSHRELRVPDPGDPVICLQNSRELQIFNGQQATVKEVLNHDEDHVLARLDFGDRIQTVPMGQTFHQAKIHFNRMKYLKVKGFVPFDYAWAVTCHKAQGSEWEHVEVRTPPHYMNKIWSSQELRRWNYTAATRARNKVTWVLG